MCAARSTGAGPSALPLRRPSGSDGVDDDGGTHGEPPGVAAADSLPCPEAVNPERRPVSRAGTDTLRPAEHDRFGDGGYALGQPGSRSTGTHCRRAAWGPTELAQPVRHRARRRVLWCTTRYESAMHKARPWRPPATLDVATTMRCAGDGPRQGEVLRAAVRSRTSRLCATPTALVSATGTFLLVGTTPTAGSGAGRRAGSPVDEAGPHAGGWQPTRRHEVSRHAGDVAQRMPTTEAGGRRADGLDRDSAVTTSNCGSTPGRSAAPASGRGRPASAPAGRCPTMRAVRAELVREVVAHAHAASGSSATTRFRGRIAPTPGRARPRRACRGRLEQLGREGGGAGPEPAGVARPAAPGIPIQSGLSCTGGGAIRPPASQSWISRAARSVSVLPAQAGAERLVLRHAVPGAQAQVEAAVGDVDERGVRHRQRRARAASSTESRSAPGRRAAIAPRA
jgi:hypothetical protein